MEPAKKIGALRRFRARLAAENHFYARLLGSTLIGVGVIALLAVAFLFIVARDQNLDNLRLRTLEITRIASKVENDLAQLGTAHRGFLLTGDANYLELFATRQKNVIPQLNELSKLVDPNSTDPSRIANVRRLVSNWISTIALPQIEKRKKGGMTAAEISAAGSPSIDEARAILEDLQRTVRGPLEGPGGHSDSLTVSYQLLSFAPRLESTVSEMQKSVWDYLLTGSSTALLAYRQADSQFDAMHGHLLVLAGEKGEPQELLREIGAGVDRWQAEFAAPEMAARQAGRGSVSRGGGAVLREVSAKLAAFERLGTERFEKASFEARLYRVGKAGGLAAACLLAIAVLIASSFYSFVAYSRHLKKIANAEAQTRSIIETTLDGVITVDDQGIVLSMNPAAEVMFTQTASQVVGKNLSILIPQRLFLHDMASLGRGTLIAVGQRQNYYPFPIEISLNELSSGSRRTYVALIRDVSERKRSEETLRTIGLGVTATTGEEFIRSLVKQLSKALQTDFAFIVQLTRKGTQVTSSLVLAEHGQIRNRNDYEIENTAAEDVLKRGMRVFQDNVGQEFPQDVLLHEVKAQSFLGLPLTDHKGNTVGVIGVMDRKPLNDMTIAESTLRIFGARAGAELERKRFEEELAAEKERLAVTLRSIGDGVITIDVEGKVVLMNSVAERFTGWRQSQACAQPLVHILHVLHERTRQPLTNAVERLVETGSAVGLEGDTIIVSVDGTERIIESSAAPIRDRNNRRIGVVLVFRDVTERIKIEEERRKAEKLESLGVAAGGIAHDFNNLLTSIIGNLSLALISLRPEESIAERLTSAKKSSLRAQELAQQLLTFAKGGAPIKKTTSIAQVIEDTVSFSLRGTSVRSEFDLARNLWAAEIDQAQISQVISNMVLNAEQAMPAGGTLHVTCDNANLREEEAAIAGIQPGRYVRIVVADEGIGISEANLEKIFDPYFTTKNNRSGLGLATAYSIIKQHEGHITVESSPGHGSTFTIFLPASAKQIVFDRPAAPAPVEPGKPTGKILILDDEVDICALVTHALTPHGYTVTETNDAATAIRVFEEAVGSGEKFDAVISDLTIPGSMGGQDAVKKLIEIDPTVRAIVSSGYSMDPVMSDYTRFGFCACLAKPYEISALCELVNDVVSGKYESLVAAEQYDSPAVEPA